MESRFLHTLFENVNRLRLPDISDLVYSAFSNLLRDFCQIGCVPRRMLTFTLYHNVVSDRLVDLHGHRS